MAQLKLISSLLLALFASQSNALIVGQFQTVTDKNASGFWTEPTGLVQDYTGHAFINNSIWFYLVRYGHQQSARLGVVAKLDLSTNTWTHFPVSEASGLINAKNKFPFALAGRLFMLVPSFSVAKIPVEKLVFWNNDHWQDVEVALPYNLCNGPITYNDVAVSVSNEAGNTAYIGASCYVKGSNSTMSFHKLVVSVNGERVSAQFTTLATGQSDLSDALLWMFDRNGAILATSRYNREGCWFCLREDHIHTVQAGSNALTSRVATRSANVKSWINVNEAVQLEQYALFMGGRQSNPLKNGETSSYEDQVRTIRSLNLDTLTWSDTGVEFPANHHPIIDQVGKRLFALSMTEGLKVARISIL